METRIVLLNREGCPRTLYCFPNILGDARAFDHVARMLDGKISVASLEFDFQAALFESRLPDGMQRLAHRCREVLVANSRGAPFCFYGNEFGGIVALSVAQDLRRAGSFVDQVILAGTVSPDVIREHVPWVDFMKMIADPAIAGNVEVEYCSLSPESRFGLDIAEYLTELEERYLGRPRAEQRTSLYKRRCAIFGSYLDRLSRHKLSVYQGRLTYVECVGDPADYRNYVRSVARDGYESRSLRFTYRTQHLRPPGVRATSDIILSVLN